MVAALYLWARVLRSWLAEIGSLARAVKAMKGRSVEADMKMAVLSGQN